MVIQVTFLMEDRGFCKDVFATVEKPTRYYNLSLIHISEPTRH